MAGPVPGMSPKKRQSSATAAGGKPAKAKKTADDLERLSQAAIQANPHVGLVEKWMKLSSIFVHK